MAVLFLDPLVLGLLAALAAYVWLVWRGSFRGWLGRPGAWTALAWPLPAFLLLVPVVGGAILWLLGLVGVVGEGGTVHAALYASIHLVPLVALTLWPPRWTLPGWARARLTELPPPAAGAPTGARAAIQAQPGHGSLARWRWRVDGVPGLVRLDGDQLRFRAADGHAPDRSGRLELDDAAIAELTLSAEGDLHLQPPRGGLWGRGHVDVDLGQVDGVTVRCRRPWRRDGLVTVHVEGRESVHLWVDDVRSLAALAVPAPAGSGA